MKYSPRAKKNKAKSSFLDRLKAYLYIHAHDLFSSLGRLFRNLLTTIMTVSVITIAIVLAVGFYLCVANIQQLTGNIEASNQISLFLKTSVSHSEGEKLADTLRKNPELERVNFISKQQALEEFKEYSGFGSALNVLEKNPLPIVIQVLPKNTLNDLGSIQRLMDEFNQIPELDFSQMDMQWVKRLQSMVHIIQRGVFLITILLGIAVLFITGNSIRLELQNRKDEVMVAKLVGATNAFIQRPFIYTGFWLGFLSGILAWIIVTLMMFVLQEPIEQLSLLYSRAFDLKYLAIDEGIYLLAMASMLGVLGSWIVLFYQLREIKPE